jgi:hypothetical protein
VLDNFLNDENEDEDMLPSRGARKRVLQDFSEDDE